MVEAMPVGNFVNNLDGSQSDYKTEARVLYDEAYLYFSFRCTDDNIWSTMKQRDEPLWHEEVVEVFLQANPNRTGGQPTRGHAGYLYVGRAQTIALRKLEQRKIKVGGASGRHSRRKGR